MKKLKTILKWSAISLMTVFLLFCIAFFISFSYTPEETAYNIDSVDWLPNTASDISFHERGGFGWIKVYNCKMSKSDFINFAEEQGWKLDEDKNQQLFRQYVINEEDIIINHSLTYMKVQRNNGGTRVIYDIENERLYVSQSHR